MKTEVKLITPKMAEAYLASVDPEKQRPLSPRTVDQYAKAMELGHWIVTHQGIAMDSNGNLCDGQHRMAAVVKSGRSVSMLVATDVAAEQGDFYTFDAIDRGRVRSIAQQLQVRHGIADSKTVASALRTIASLCRRDSVALTVGTALDILKHFEGSIRYVSGQMQIRQLRYANVVGALAFCHRAMPKQLESFIARVGDGDGIKRGEASFALRNAILTGHVRNGSHLMGHEKSCCLCAMHHVLNNKVMLVKSTMAGVDFFADKQPRIVDEIAALF